MVTGIPPPESFRDIAERIDALLEALSADVYDDETVQSIGQTAHLLSTGKVNLLIDLKRWIAPAVEAEAEDRARAAAEESIEAAYRQAGIAGDASTAILDRVMDGDR